MGKHIRMTALLLAVSLFLNMVVLPVHAEELLAQEDLLTSEETVPETTAETVPETTAETVPETTTETVPETTAETVPETTAETVPETTAETVPETTAETVPETTAETVPETTAETVPETTTETAPETTAETVPETTAESLLEETEPAESESLLLESSALGDTMLLTEEGEASALNAECPLTLEKVFENYTGNSTELSIRSGAELILLSQVNPSDYQNLNLKFANNVSGGYDTTGKATYNGVDYVFQGLGNSDYPYQGTVTVVVGTQSTPIKLSRPLFKALSDSASIGDETFGVLLEYCPPEGGTMPSALLAEQVYSGSVETAKEWYIRTVAASAATSAPPIIGTIQSGARVSLNVNNSESSNIQAVEGSTHAGFLCAKMEVNSSLTLNSLTLANDVSLPTVTAKNGDAGSLVGKMNSGASLTITAGGGETVSLPISNVTASGSAGGLVGSAVDADISLTSLTGSGVTIKGDNAGGLIGSYTYSGTSMNTVSMNIDAITVNGSSNAGGVFGVLKNTSAGAAFTINSGTVSTTLITDSTSGNAGGLIGQYSAADLNATLSLNPSNVTAELTDSASAFGGLIGWVSGGSAYLELSGDVKLTGTAKLYGGLIGSFYDNSYLNSGHMVVVNQVTLSKKNDGAIIGTEKAGGLIGWQPHGVLKLAGGVNVATPECEKKDSLGNILGYRDNTLVYSTSQWTPMDGGKNDIGNWGQVLCANQLSGLLNESKISTSHTVTVIAPASASIGTVVDFAKVAMQFQLSSKDALIVEASTVDLTKITLTDNINLTGTGLTGFQRDVNVTPLGVTLNGDGHTITLPGIKTYVYSGAHDYQGLFSKVTALASAGLTISGGGSYTEGETTTSNIGIQLECNGNFYVGGLAADASGDISLTSVTAGASIITKNGSTAAIGGLVGRRSFSSAAPGTLTCTNCTWNTGSEINVSGNSSGIYVGGLVGRVDNEKQNDAGMEMEFKSCTISGKLSRTGKPDDARIGGMLGACYGRKSNFTLLIDSVKVENATVTSDAKNEMGGLLSLEWLDTNVTVKNVVVKNSTVSSTNTSSFGGLVFKAMGYCKIESTTTTEENGNTTTTPGVTIESGTFSGPSPSTAPSALLICHGEERGTLDNALYLEILDGAYQIESGGITLDLKGGTTFDEIIGTTFGNKAEGNGNGIVSIATSGDLIYKETDGVKSRNTYGNQLSTNYTNSRTRYYYNLDSFGAVDAPPSGDIGSPGEMVMFSAYSHADDSIKGYFYSGSGSITGTIDLTGYSYYPAEQFVDISGATIKFAYEDMNQLEVGNKPFSDSERQHYGMHTGIFSSVTSKKSLMVNNLTLKGNVGPYKDSGSGALICGTAQGSLVDGSVKKTQLTITDVNLEGIRVSGGDTSIYAPLLINKIGSYASLVMRDVTTTAAYTDTSGNPITAATSLIGNVGNAEDGTDIDLNFGLIALDARITEGAALYNTTKSIFSHATLLESFFYRNESTCGGEYNFRMTDAPTEGSLPYYTVGCELSNTNSGRNLAKQYKDLDGEYVYDTTDNHQPTTDDEAAAYFSDEKYLRYVYTPEVKDQFQFELDINQQQEAIIDGCGTYSHPYIITSGAQLEAVAAVIEDSKSSGWSVILNVDTNGGIVRDHTHTTGNANHVAYTCDANGNWTTDNGVSMDATKIQEHLRNAYYQIDGDIVLGERGGWAGLGYNEGTNTFFSGVIVGKDTPTVTIRGSTGSQFGGLIRFSQGSVVKDLNVNYESLPSISASGSAPTSTADASFFGGVVGWCLGGDTIIDNVTVTMSGTPTVTGTNAHLTAVGGYVGMVGGGGPTVKYGGGVVFRNMTDGSGMTGGNAEAGNHYFYVNPFVGRVLDGYVMSENQQLDNTDKNYTIPQITSENHLAYDENTKTVMVNDAEGLWLLSAIANSGAGSIHDGNCWAYTKGKARTGTYQQIGDTMPDVDKADESYLGGTENKSKKISYLTAKYTTGAFYNLCSSTGVSIGVSIVLDKDCDMSTFGNGFRGIGASYATLDSSNYRLIPVSSITSAEGKTYTITLGQSRKEYTEEKDSWTSIGSGLFVLLRVPKNGSFSASNLNLKGSTGIEYYYKQEDGFKPCDSSQIIKNDKNPISGWDSNNRLSLVGAGMLAGNLAKNDKITSFKLDTVTLAGEGSDRRVTVNDSSVGSTHAGGLVGLLRNDGTITNVTVKDCKYDYLTVTGRMNAGGLIGYLKSTNAEVQYSTNLTMTDGKIYSTQNKANNKFGCGGLIGYSEDANLSIGPARDEETARLTLKDLTVQGNAGSGAVNNANVGGVVGFWKAYGKTASAKNISIEGTVTIAGRRTGTSYAAVGGLIGFVGDEIANWGKAETKGLIIESIWLAQESCSDVKVYNGRPAGGLIGWMKAKSTSENPIAISDIKIGSKNSSVTVANNTNNDQWHTASGLIGSNVSLSDGNILVTIRDIQIVNTTVLFSHFNNYSDVRGTGILLSNIENNTSIDLQNVLLDNCKAISNNESTRVGVLFSDLDIKGSGCLSGSNILIKNCTVGWSDEDFSTKENKCPELPLPETIKNNGEKMGIIGGDCRGQTVKLVGVSIQQEEKTLPMKDFGTAPSSDSYVIRADYTGAANGNASEVTTSPAGHLTIGETTFTGDGASFMEGGTTSIASQIWDESNGTANLNWKHYSQIKDGSLAYLKDRSGIVTFSDYETAGENTYPENANFPVVCLQTSSNTELNNSLFSCISLLTNWEEYSNWSKKTYYKLSLTSYKWTENGFVKNNDPSLWLGEDGKFYLYPGKYDNQKNQFNLIDVAYYDPSVTNPTPTENDVVYHLYIPVVVKKMFEFKFWAAAKLGTDYTDSGYPLTGEDALSRAVIGSNGQKVTTLLTYEYQWTKAEWETAINSGQNLLWNFQHQVKLANGSGLPSGTKLTLVDLGQEDKAFFWKTTEPTSSSISFGNFTGDSGPWSPVDLCDLLNLEATAAENGKYVLAGENADGKDSTGATIRAGGLYYRPAEETDAEKQHYTINVGLGETEKVTEQFYLTIQTPENAAGMVNADIESPNPLVNPATNGGLPTKAEKANDARTDNYQFAWNKSENKLILGSFFNQNLTVTTARGTDQELITANDSKIDITLETDISFMDTAAQLLYNTYASGQTLYHCFELKANKYDAQNQKTSAMIAAGTEITVQFYKGENTVGQKVHYYVGSPTPSYRLYFPYEIPATDVENGLTLRAEVSLNYSAAAIQEQFPTRTSETDQAGIAIAATSNLAYNNDSLRSSPIRSTEQEAQKESYVPHYYRNQEGAATLYYCAYEDQDGSWAEGVSELGINGLDGNSFAIHTAAAYNVSALPEAASATTLQCTVELQRQTENSSYDSPSYESVGDLSSYLTELTVSAGTTGTVSNSRKNALSGTVEFTMDEIGQFDPDIPIEIPIDLVVRTGEAFEGDNLTYANYRVCLKVELLDGNGDLISGSDATDYIVYTNAKIYRGLIGSSTG